MSIVYVQPIFAPDKARLERNLESIKSFGNYMKEFPFSGLNIVLGGWSKPEYWGVIKQTITEYMGSGIPIKRFDKNYGKAVVVNTLYKSIGTNTYSHMLTADSDIVFNLNVPNLLQRCLEAASVSESARKLPFGLMSLNQSGQNCHLSSHVYQNRLPFDGTNGPEEIVWPSGNGGIAGGCLFTSTKCWEAVGGYRVMGIYSGDDAYYLIDAAQKGFSLQMFESCAIIHPHDNDEEYAKWKVKVCQRDSGPIKKDLSFYIKEADEFWESHGKK